MSIQRVFLPTAAFLLIVAIVSAVPVHAATVRQQFKASVAELQKNPDNQALREKIIKLARKLKPKPAVPKEARRRMARGRAAVKAAEDEDGFQEAAKEFEKAALAAPWLALAYYNLGIVQDKAGDYAGAIKNLNLYLLAAPGAKNAAVVEEKIFGIEFIREKKEKNTKKLADARKALRKLKGIWHGRVCSGAVWPSREGCDKKEYGGRHWHLLKTDNVPDRFEFKFLDDGTVKLESWEITAKCKGTVYGIPNGPDMDQIRWEDHPKDGDPKPIYAEISSDGSLKISCDKPLSAGDFNSARRYHYIQYTRP